MAAFMRVGFSRMACYGLVAGILSGSALYLPWGLFWAPGILFGIAVMLPFRRAIPHWPAQTYGAVLLSGGLYFTVVLILADVSLYNHFLHIPVASLISSSLLGWGISALLRARMSRMLLLCFAGAGILGGLLFEFIGFVSIFNPDASYRLLRVIVAYGAWQSIVAGPVGLLKVPLDSANTERAAGSGFSGSA